MSDQLELSAWRFLASHRATASLCVTHVQFIDAADGSGKPCRMNTPSSLEFYASERGATFGEAAINLALTLGMPCPTGCEGELTDSEEGSSSAPTAASGESEKSTPLTREGSAGSTTGATGVGLSTEIALELGRLGDALTEAVRQVAGECRARASEWRRAGREDLAEAFRRVEVVVGGIQ